MPVDWVLWTPLPGLLSLPAGLLSLQLASQASAEVPEGVAAATRLSRLCRGAPAPTPGLLLQPLLLWHG